MATSHKLVTVYNPDGEPEQHTRANARDLINGAGFTWEPNRPTTPAALAPFAVPPHKASAKPASQEVLDRVGGTAVLQPTEPEGEEVEDVPEQEPDVEDAPEPEPEPEPAPPAPRSRRHRQ